MNIKEKLKEANNLVMGDGKSETFLEKVRKNNFSQTEFENIKNLLISINDDINKAADFPYDDALELSSLMNVFFGNVALYVIDTKSKSDALAFICDWIATVGNINN